MRARVYRADHPPLLPRTVQIIATVTCINYSRKIKTEPAPALDGSVAAPRPYLSSSAVVLSEFLKVFMATWLVIRDEGGISKGQSKIYQSVFVEWGQTLRMALPAALYAVQNNLLFIALSHLDSAVYQIVYQIKTLTTAMFAVLILRKRVTRWQWVSLVLLATGVAIVQLGVNSKKAHKSGNRSPFVGICAVLAACLSSGFAGIYFEKVLKTAKQSVWIRNIQLGIFGGMASIVTMFVVDGDALSTYGFFHGYSNLTWTVIALQASTGLIVAITIKYTDNIVKAFAGAFAIIGASMVSVYINGLVLDRNFVFGGGLVVVATYIYGTNKPKKASN